MVTGEYRARRRGRGALFVDEHHSCRSQMAEGIATSLDQPNFLFASAPDP
jgi:hypothetical protein